MESKKKLKICFVAGDPDFGGGISVFLHNFIKYLNSINYQVDITWVYSSQKNRIYKKDNINYVEIKVIKTYPLDQFQFNFKVASFLKKNKFDIINSHAVWGYWMKSYRKEENQILVNTYHGTTFYFFKNHLKRFNFLKKMIFFPTLLFGYIIEKPPMRRSDKIICVSNRVKEEVLKIYGKRKNVFMIRSGVDKNLFKIRDKVKIRVKLKLEQDKIYGLYIGRGGYYRKGLDRAIKISEEIHKMNKRYCLLVLAPDVEDMSKIGGNKRFIKIIDPVPRDKMPDIYNSSDIFFCMSRYEGGAPTLVVSEALSSGCLVVCSKDSKQEVIEDEKNGLIIGENYEKEAERVLKIFKDKQKLKKILINSQRLIKEKLTLKLWGKKYLDVLLN